LYYGWIQVFYLGGDKENNRGFKVA
jgi:hypothetical protein